MKVWDLVRSIPHRVLHVLAGGCGFELALALELPALRPSRSSGRSGVVIGRCKYNNATANGVIRPPEQHSSDKWITQGCVRAAETHADHAK